MTHSKESRSIQANDAHPLAALYPVCAALLSGCTELEKIDPQNLPGYLAAHQACWPSHPFLPELADLEQACARLAADPPAVPGAVSQLTINPTLQLLSFSWQGLPEYLAHPAIPPAWGQSHVLLWYSWQKGRVLCRTPSGHDLLALKMVSEDLDSRLVAREVESTAGAVDDILLAATACDLVLAPPSALVRPADFPRGMVENEEFFTAQTFTLQWHITQRCDLHCRHCYDRSERADMTLEQGIRVLDDLYAFGRQHHVFIQVSFSGGNPLLHPHFFELYRAAAERGFLTAVLGNPMDKAAVEPMLAIQQPVFYQISLEGLEEHNDTIRGRGHFRRALAFLNVLRELKVFSMVMLTLTRDNQDQVLDLAEMLRHQTDLFTFNRLSAVGEGAALAQVPVEGYADFLARYARAAKDNPVIRLKDNFFNLLRYQQGYGLIGGCAGKGCGAAFNFLSLLPDGEVHACRKLPSLLGNIYRDSLQSIYHSPLAQRYRQGSSACRRCAIRPACGGCPAVMYGLGMDIFTGRDPYCFAPEQIAGPPEIPSA